MSNTKPMSTDPSQWQEVATPIPWEPLALAFVVAVIVVVGFHVLSTRAPSPEKVRETYQRAEEPCPNCGSEDYWHKPTKWRMTMHRCLNCRSEGIGPGFDIVRGGDSDG